VPSDNILEWWVQCTFDQNVHLNLLSLASSRGFYSTFDAAQHILLHQNCYRLRIEDVVDACLVGMLTGWVLFVFVNNKD